MKNNILVIMLFIVVCLVSVGIFIGTETTKKAFIREAIEHNVGEYNSSTSKFQWIKINRKEANNELNK
jgi:hypothetical protein